jgi:large subunit ribosomal protein L24
MTIKKGDQVVVIAGKDIDKRGKVVEVLPAKDRALVEKVNIVHKHRRPTRTNRQGGIVEMEAPIHLSNLMVVCPKCDRGVRVRKMQLADGKRVRICARAGCGEVIDKT